MDGFPLFVCLHLLLQTSIIFMWEKNILNIRVDILLFLRLDKVKDRDSDLL